MDVRTKIEQKINDALRRRGIADPVVVLDYPADMTHGDYASNVALMYAKEIGCSPKELAQNIVQKIGELDGVSKTEVAGPGFINFTLSNESINTFVNYSITQGDAWGSGNVLVGQNTMVEYTDPNPFKEFHIGHLMSNAIGESIARLLAFQGAHIIRANYQGDVGVHVACALWGIKKLGFDPADAQRHGEAYAYGATANKENTEAQKEIQEINKAVYRGVLENESSEWFTLYQVGRQASLARFEDMYALLGTTFDTYYFESAVGAVGKDIVLSYPDVFVVSDGARVFKGEEYGLHTRVFLNAEGLPTYEAKELGLEKQKMQDYPHLATMIVVTANEISEYFKVLKKAMELVYPDIAKKLTHISHGMMKLPTGKMSSRTGSVVTGASLIRDMQDAVYERLTQSEKTEPAERDMLSRALAVGAIKYQILKQHTSKDIIFEKEKALSVEGDSGPYLQYTHARCVSILEKAGTQKSIETLKQGAPTQAERLLIRFPDVCARSAREYAPHYVAQYILELASAFNSWYAQEHILDGSSSQAHKVAVTQAVQQTLKNGLYLLGATAPNNM